MCWTILRALQAAQEGNQVLLLLEGQIQRLDGAVQILVLDSALVIELHPVLPGCGLVGRPGVAEQNNNLVRKGYWHAEIGAVNVGGGERGGGRVIYKIGSSPKRVGEL